MPKQVDHEQRRRQIAEALWRITAGGGLEAASLNEVAAEAGVSKGMVQHYFTTKDEMLAFATGYLRERVDQRVRRQLGDEPESLTARVRLRAVLTGLLPADEDSRTESLVSNAFFIRALTQPQVAARFREGHSELLDVLAGQIRAARDGGELPAGLDPRREADILLALVGGMGDSLLLGYHTTETALATIDYHLDRLTAPAETAPAG